MFPSQLLIRAAVGEGEDVIAAWCEWSASRDMDSLDPADLRYLPLVYRRLLDSGVAEEEIAPIAKKMYRATWIRTRLLLHEAAAVVDLLDAHGMDAILLKGAAMVAGYYRDFGVRPMSDFDVLVRPDSALATATLLERAGWHASSPLDEKRVTFLHAAVFTKGEWACDLHWWTLRDSRNAEGDERFRRGAERVTLGGLSARVLRPEHQLLHVIVHGTRRYAPAQRWISDSMEVIRRRGHVIDWALLREETEARRLQYPVGDALAYLSQQFNASVPEDVVAALQAAPTSKFRRGLYEPGQSDERGDPPTYFRALLWALLNETKAESPMTRLMWLPRNLQYGWDVPSLGRLPAEIARRGARWMTQARRPGTTR